MKNEKIANVKTTRKEIFFKWVEFTKPFHGLRTQLQSVLALLLYHHYNLSQIINNDKILWKQVFDYDTKVALMNELDVKPQTLENLFTELRKRGVIVNNTIPTEYIPEINKETKYFTIRINFKIDD